jgi:hypothetical protein
MGDFDLARGGRWYQSMRRLRRTERRAWLLRQPETWQEHPPVAKFAAELGCCRSTIWADLAWLFKEWVPEQEAARQRRRRGGLASAAKRRAA